MKSKKINIKRIIVLIVIIIALVIANLNNKNFNIQKQESSKEQLETTLDNAYVSLQTHLSELNDKQQEIDNVKTLMGSPDWKQFDYANKNRGWIQYHNTATSYVEPIDVTEYKYLVLEYNRYNYYNQTIGMGLYDTSKPTYEQCLNAEVKVTESSTGTSSNTFTPRLLYIDISEIEGNKYPFVYITSDMYEHILHFYLTKSFEIPKLSL